MTDEVGGLMNDEQIGVLVDDVEKFFHERIVGDEVTSLKF
jgi:hypothetical protein